MPIARSPIARAPIARSGRAAGAASGLAAGTISVTAHTSTSVNLSTTAASGGTAPYNYQFQRAQDLRGSPGAWSNIGPNSTATTFNATGLTTGLKWWFRVVVTDAASNQAISNQVSQITDGARDYYLAPFGSDTNDGLSSSTPLQTTTELLSNTSIGAQTGDRLFLGPGSAYSSTWTFANAVTLGTFGGGGAGMSRARLVNGGP